MEQDKKKAEQPKPAPEKRPAPEPAPTPLPTLTATTAPKPDVPASLASVYDEPLYAVEILDESDPFEGNW